MRKYHPHRSACNKIKPQNLAIIILEYSKDQMEKHENPCSANEMAGWSRKHSFVEALELNFTAMEDATKVAYRLQPTAFCAMYRSGIIQISHDSGMEQIARKDTIIYRKIIIIKRKV